MTAAFSFNAYADAVVTHADGTTDADDTTSPDTTEQATDDSAEG